MNNQKFIPCTHLDLDPEKYPSCKLVDWTKDGYPGFRYWIREDPDGNPQAVQFCKKRGRLYNIFGCYGDRDCYCKGASDV